MRRGTARWLATVSCAAVLVTGSAVVAHRFTDAGAATTAGTAAGVAAGAPATPADVLGYLGGIASNQVVSGMHNKEPIATPAAYTNKVHDITGQYPGLWGSDLTFDDVGNRQTMVDEAKRQWAAGSLVALTWHVCPPTMAEPCGWDGGVLADLSDTQWNQLVTDGTELNRAWKARLDVAAGYLQQLEDAGIPVLWRPLHEMNDGWAWWGGRPGASGSRRLFQITHDHLAGTRGLSNLIWVWAPKDVSTALADYYPGDGYVDVVGLDVWMSKWPSKTMYDAVASVAGNKPMALAEVGRVPTAAELASQPRWTYFMCWSEYLTDPAYNSDDAIRATYADGRILNQGELRLGSTTPAPSPSASKSPSAGASTPPGGGNLAQGRPAYASSTDSADRPASAAFDGNTTTRWSSAYADEQWIYVDLGSVRTVTGATLVWETAYARMYQIQTSTDGGTWTTVFHDYAADGGTDALALPATRARYVKMYAWQRATGWGYSLWEFQVTGS